MLQVMGQVGLIFIMEKTNLYKHLGAEVRLYLAAE